MFDPTFQKKKNIYIYIYAHKKTRFFRVSDEKRKTKTCFETQHAFWTKRGTKTPIYKIVIDLYKGEVGKYPEFISQ